MVWGEANPQKPNNHGTDAEKLEFDWVAHVATGTPPTYTKNDCVAIQPSTPKTTTTTKNVPDTEDLPCRYIVCDACPDRTHLKGKVMQLERGLEFLLLRERQRQGNDSLRITDVVETAGLVFEGKTTDAAVEAAKIRTFVESNQGLLKNAMELLEEGRLFCAVMPKPPEALPTKELKELGDKLDTAWGAVKTLKMEMKTVEAQLADLRANIAIIEEALRKQGLM
ncbi:hypothetical protein HK104_008085 [Borealophlyctis nickersoniae]|nr:hypothetical protein HK104_008085 [Borealophlyctis nickersoniae]